MNIFDENHLVIKETLFPVIWVFKDWTGRYVSEDRAPYHVRVRGEIHCTDEPLIGSFNGDSVYIFIESVEICGPECDAYTIIKIFLKPGV